MNNILDNIFYGLNKHEQFISTFSETVVKSFRKQSKVNKLTGVGFIAASISLFSVFKLLDEQETSIKNLKEEVEFLKEELDNAKGE